MKNPGWFFVLLFVLVGCNNSLGGGGGSSAPDCKATVKDKTGLFNTYLTSKSPYAVAVKVNNYDDILRHENSTCIQTYELALIKFNLLSLKDGSPLNQVNVITAWKKVETNGALITFSNFTVEKGDNFVDVCLRSTSQYGQQTLSCKDIWLNDYISTPDTSTTPITTTLPAPSSTPTPGQTDTTPPSTPTNLSISATWGYSETIYLNFSQSYDFDSGIKTYVSAVLDANYKQITPDKEGLSASVSLSSLTPGADYYFAIMAQNNAGLYSQVALKKFYYPAKISVTLNYNSLYAESCFSSAISMFDLQLVKLMQKEYIACDLIKKTTSTYVVDCRAYQQCTYTGYNFVGFPSCNKVYGLTNGYTCSNYYAPSLPVLSGSNY